MSLFESPTVGKHDLGRIQWTSQGSEAAAAEILQRQQPFDLEAEMGVIGSVLLLPEVSDEIASLRPDDFYDDANRKIYETLREMHDTGEKIDITLLVSKLRTAGEHEKVGAQLLGETLRIRSQRCSRRLLRGYRYGEGSFSKIDRVEHRDPQRLL